MNPLNVSVVPQSGSEDRVRLCLHNTSGINMEGYSLIFAVRCSHPEWYTYIGIECTDGVLLPGESHSLLVQLNIPHQQVERWKVEYFDSASPHSCPTAKLAAPEHTNDLAINKVTPSAAHGARSSEIPRGGNALRGSNSTLSIIDTKIPIGVGAETVTRSQAETPACLNSIKTWNAVMPSSLPHNDGTGSPKTTSSPDELQINTAGGDDHRYPTLCNSQSTPCVEGMCLEPYFLVHCARLCSMRSSVSLATKWIDVQKSKYDKWLREAKGPSKKKSANVLSCGNTSSNDSPGNSPLPSALGEPVRWMKYSEKPADNGKRYAFWRKPFSKSSSKMFKYEKQECFSVKITCEITPCDKTVVECRFSIDTFSNDNRCEVVTPMFYVNSKLPSMFSVEKDPRQLTSDDRDCTEKGLQLFEYSDGTGHREGYLSPESRVSMCGGSSSSFRLRRGSVANLTECVPFGRLEAPAQGTSKDSCHPIIPSPGSLRPESPQGKFAADSYRESECFFRQSISSLSTDARHNGRDASTRFDWGCVYNGKWSCLEMLESTSLFIKRTFSGSCSFVKRSTPHAQALMCGTLSFANAALRLTGCFIENSADILYISVMPVLIAATLCVLFAIAGGCSYSSELDTIIREIV
uniref:Uncharacterized protein n=1 Tax=Trypanosoma congolense (strain IL3000) TaxID=1068625 RepID=G0UMR6_TRYCI|nr:conserved hypothetical protein [Trypanosoma congolense IL3000]